MTIYIKTKSFQLFLNLENIILNEFNKNEKKFDSENLKRIIQLKKNLEATDKTINNKDKIIEILRDEIKLITQVNQKIIEEKDKEIQNLKHLIKEHENKIENLNTLLKKNKNIPNT